MKVEKRRERRRKKKREGKGRGRKRKGGRRKTKVPQVYILINKAMTSSLSPGLTFHLQTYRCVARR